MAAVGLLGSLLIGSPCGAEPAAPDTSGALKEGLVRLITGHIGRFLVLRSELSVTPEQKTKIREAVESRKDRIGPVVKSLKDKRRALRDAVRAETPDEAAIRAAADQLGKAIADAAVLASQVVADARKVMTDEQRSRIEQFIKANDTAQDGFLKEFFGQ
jgi:Spy/CpxP family protein refolding chaperone